MRQYGSCNAYAWQVQDKVYIPYRQGKQNTTQRTDSIAEIGVDIVRNDNAFGRVIKGGVGTGWGNYSLVLWEYEGTYHDPEIWIVRSSSDEVLNAWESETLADYRKGSGNNPLITTMQTGQSIIPSGGSVVKLFFPGLDLLVDDVLSITNDISASVIPGWISGTSYSDITDPLELLKSLYRSTQYDHGLTFPLGSLSIKKTQIFDTITDAHNYDMNVKTMLLMTLIWLRQASKIMYNHSEETCIPLLMDKFKVDSDGLPTYSA